MGSDDRKVKIPIIKPKRSKNQKVEYVETELIDLHLPKKFEKISKIEKDTLIAEIILSYPELSIILVEDAGLHCIGCPASSFESIGDGCAMHGMSPEDLDKLLKKLNDGIKKIDEKRKTASSRD